jgi:hypothetical protein
MKLIVIIALGLVIGTLAHAQQSVESMPPDSGQIETQINPQDNTQDNLQNSDLSYGLSDQEFRTMSVRTDDAAKNFIGSIIGNISDQNRNPGDSRNYGGDGRRDNHPNDGRNGRAGDGYDNPYDGRHGHGGGARDDRNGRRPVQVVACYAQNARGKMFRARGYDQRQTSQQALNACYRISRQCRLMGCESR